MPPHLPRLLVIAVASSGCELPRAPRPPLEVKVGGPYSAMIDRWDPGAVDRSRPREIDHAARDQSIFFHIQYRALSRRVLEQELVDTSGARCWTEVLIIDDDSPGWGHLEYGLPTGFDPPCVEGEFAHYTFLPGRYTLRTTVDRILIDQRSFLVQ